VENVYTKTIEFYPSSKEVEIVVPYPKPAKSYIPEWYKSIKTLYGEGPKFSGGSVINKNVRSCLPFFDAISSGYIQETWCDIHVSLNDNNFEYHFSSGPEILGHREKQDIKISNMFYKKEFIWKVPWVPKTSKNYSILYIHPLNRIDLPFFSLSGIVDSDKYFHADQGNLPFYFQKNFEGVIPKGTPMYQIIPIKRNHWKSESKGFNYESSLKRSFIMKSQFIGVYKKLFYQKKRYE
jgi:hypothetical protein